jgi:asparagine synthase (glutamine-hydrolysing)
VPQCALSRSVGAQGIRVCLTGDGADEFFGGYGRSMRYDSQASDVFHELVAWHLPRLDRIMMRNLVEVRSPFLARRVAGIALGLPRTARYNKGILRSLFRADLPPGVADVSKRPLRTKRVEDDRESRSMELVRMFTENLKGTEICQG